MAGAILIARQKKVDLLNQATLLVNKASDENRDLTPEEADRHGKILIKVAETVTEITRIEAAMDRERQMGAALFGKGPGGDSSAPGQYSSFGEFLSLVHEAGIPGHQTDQRLFAGPSGMGEGIPSEGGFLLEQSYSRELLDKVFEGGQILSRVRRITVAPSGNSVKLPIVAETSRATGSRWGGIQVYRVAESDQKTASKPKIGALEVNLKKLAGLCYVSDELLEDAALLETICQEGFRQEFEFTLEDEIIRGDGAGQMLGILNAPALITVAKETGQEAKTLVFENIVKMYARLPAPSKQNAVWLINQDVEPQLFTMGIVVGVGGTPAFLPAGAWSGTPFNTIFGRPVLPVEYCETLGAKGDIILADFSQYLLAEKGVLRAASSIHVRFLYDETAFRFVMRNDGQPIWSGPRTPYKGSDTVSPFVTLAARA